ncbi:hypothetical protein N7466_011017 [Penicillium verhagenii]|uniref:uncharacterized protein n=1 Tax=Penicillium verhagenii TaxID=1562060 RepID=UPI002544EAA9|nr:uncharacterized protein N7466_011017 [Penicillium verhagenii]KAJ5917463.1 hypothetical protein N7466_011017 [Penicillium verhagenii]
MNERGQYRRSPDQTEAWILGSGTASLASALYLVQFANVPASKVHILDSHLSMGQVLHNNGDPIHGYDQFAGCLPVPAGNPLKELLGLVPSVNRLGHSVLDDIQSAQTGRANQHKGRTRFLVQKNHVLNDIHTNSLNLNTKHRLELILFMLKSEKRLGRNQIRDFLPNSFFQSTFWTIWSAQFGFQPWHSAIEFKRALRQHLSGFHSLSILSCLDITGYYQQDSIFLPLFLHLQSLGVDFHFDTTITDIVSTIRDGQETISQLRMIQNGFQMQQKICPDDVVIIAPGSTASGMTRGTNDHPPGRHSLEPYDELDENWAIWLEIGTRNEMLGNPYNFCTRESESILESFTITTSDPGLIEYVDLHTHNDTDGGSIVLLKESPWKLSCCIPTQPVFIHQPSNVRIFWGFALFPRRLGEYVQKPMHNCSGAEITKELLGHLRFVSQPSRTTTIPRVMPRMTAMLLIRSQNDRPQVIPPNTSNLALVGDFVEIPHYSCVDTSYAVRTAQVAVSRLMGLDLLSEQRESSIFDLFRILLWK